LGESDATFIFGFACFIAALFAAGFPRMSGLAVTCEFSVLGYNLHGNSMFPSWQASSGRKLAVI
jgi:hypothetical protein